MSQEGGATSEINTKGSRQTSKQLHISNIKSLDANKDLEAKVEDKGNEEPVIIETHQNNFTISSFDDGSIHHNASQRQDASESLVIDQQASNSQPGTDTIEQQEHAEMRKGTIEEERKVY